jgi:hypothetical protein
MDKVRELEKQVATDLNKAVPSCLERQEELSREIENVIFGFMKCQMKEGHALDNPMLTESVVARVRRRRELLDEALTAAVGDLRTIVAKETGLIKQALPRLRSELVVTASAKTAEDAGGPVVEEAEVVEVAPSPHHGMVEFARQLGVPLRGWCEKNVTRLEDALDGARDALEDYEKAVDGAEQGRVASVVPPKAEPEPASVDVEASVDVLETLRLLEASDHNDHGFDLFGPDHHGFDLFVG